MLDKIGKMNIIQVSYKTNSKKEAKMRKYIIKNKNTGKEIPCRNLAEARKESRIMSEKTGDLYVIVIR